MLDSASLARRLNEALELLRVVGLSASGLACVIAASVAASSAAPRIVYFRSIAMYYSSLMPRTYLCARLLETLD